jgi:YbbR domain-containing protein
MRFLRNIPLKIASLFIALVLAFAVQRASNVSMVSLFVPLEVKNTPEERIIVKPIKRGAQVTLKGPSFVVGPLAAAPPPLRVKLPDGVGERATVSLQASDLALPPSIEVLSIEPSQVEFVLESIERQELKVTVPRIGQLSKDLVLEGIEVTPKSIVVRGPRAEIKQLKTIETEPVDLSVLDSSKELQLNVRGFGGAITPESRTVLARIVIGEQPTTKSFAQVPVEVRVSGGVSGGFKVVPNVVSITVSGSPSAISGINSQDLFPYVRSAEVVNGGEGSRAQVQVQLPSGVKVVSMEPSVVAVQPIANLDEKQGSAARTAAKRK